MRSFFKKHLHISYVAPLFIYVAAAIARFAASPYLQPVYDEVAYSSTSLRIASSGEWFNIYGSDDLFFFPPLFKWFGAIFVSAGFERLQAVRSVTILLSSGIPAVLYLLLRKSGLDVKTSFAASFIWIVFPGVTHYSIAGQVETPFIFFVFLSLLFFLKRNENSTLNIILSAIFFSMAVWIKETPFGFVPVFVLIMLQNREFKAIGKWCLTILFLIFPLLIQSFLPHNYDMFFELSNDNITWGSISFIKPFTNMGELAGVTANLPGWLFILLNVVVSSVFISGAVYCFIKYRHIELIRFSLLSLLIFIPFFALFPKKFHYYLLPVLLLFLICLSFAFFKDKKWIVVSSILVLLLSFNGLAHTKTVLDVNYQSSLSIISRLEAENPAVTASIVSPTPELIRYIAEKRGLYVAFAGIDFTSRKDGRKCMEKKDRCILDHDYYITDDMFFEVIFCKTWPIKIENCDIEAMKYVISNTELLISSGGCRLYKVVK